MFYVNHLQRENGLTLNFMVHEPIILDYTIRYAT